MTESDILKSLLQSDVASLQRLVDDESTHINDNSSSSSSSNNDDDNKRVDGKTEGQFNFSEFLRWHQQSETDQSAVPNESSRFLAQFARAQNIDRENIDSEGAASQSLKEEGQQGLTEVTTAVMADQPPRIRYTRDQLLALKDHPLSNRKVEIKDTRALPRAPPSAKSPQKRPVVDTEAQRKEKTRDRSGRALLPTPNTTPRGKRVPGSSPRKGTSKISPRDRKTTRVSSAANSVARTTSWMTNEGEDSVGSDETKGV